MDSDCVECQGEYESGAPPEYVYFVHELFHKTCKKCKYEMVSCICQTQFIMSRL